MSEIAIQHPPGFRRRRGLNWAFIGLLYTSFYMCRYNFSIANGAISQEFGFSKADMGGIITTALLAYACGQIINGLLADRLGGKRAMLIGAAGTVVMNVALRLRFLLGLALDVRHHPRDRRLPAGLRCARHGENQRRLVRPSRARPFRRHLRVHDQSRALRDFQTRSGARSPASSFSGSGKSRRSIGAGSSGSRRESRPLVALWPWR